MYIKYKFSYIRLLIIVLVAAHGGMIATVHAAENDTPIETEEVSSTMHKGEIQYARLVDARGSDLIIRYTGPSGAQNFICDTGTEVCESFGDETPDIFPAPDIDENDILYSKKSPNRQYMLVKTVATPAEPIPCPCAANENEDEPPNYVHTLYDISGETAEQVAVLPYTKDTVRYKFSWANDHVALYGKNGEVMLYVIETEETRFVTISESGLSYHSISPHAKYIAAYHSNSKEHRIWNTHTGALHIIPGEPSGFFMDFSYDEKTVAFLDKRTEDGVQTMFIVDIEDVSTDAPPPVKQVFKDDFTITDSRFLPDKMFYVIGNTPENPYNWVLYQYNPETEESRIVREGVSYGGYIRHINNQIQFLVIEGKNTHVALYSSETDTTQVIRAVEPSPASENIEREVLQSSDGVYSVLYKPKNHNPQNKKLFVWLHGGPIRQTSVGYHSYGSYARFDELLERLVDAGSYVLKVDFAGSFGYGKAFENALERNMGVLDAKHVVDATRGVQKKYHNKIKETYLIGLSYGGYLGPKVLVDYQKYFDGAISINGVYDWFVWLEENPLSDSFKRWFNERTPDLFNLEENFELYKNASIVKGIPALSDNKKLLLIYGENDRTVLPAQTRELFYFARLFGKDARLFKFDDEGHVIKKRENLNMLCQYIADELNIEGVACGDTQEGEAEAEE